MSKKTNGIEIERVRVPVRMKEREREEKNSKKTNEPEVERERGGVGGVPGVRDRQIHHDFPPLANLTCSNIEIFMEKKTCKDKSDNSFVW